MRTEGILFLAVMLLASLIFQIQTKILADQTMALLVRSDMTTGEIVRLGLQQGIHWRIVLVGLFAIATFFLFFLALTRLELSLAMPITAVGLLINTIASGLILGEALTAYRIIGAAIVTVGLILVLRS